MSRGARAIQACTFWAMWMFSLGAHGAPASLLREAKASAREFQSLPAQSPRRCQVLRRAIRLYQRYISRAQGAPRKRGIAALAALKRRFAFASFSLVVVPTKAAFVLRHSAGLVVRGTSPYAITLLCPGRYSLVLSKPGYRSRTLIFVLKAGEHKGARLVLEDLGPPIPQRCPPRVSELGLKGACRLWKRCAEGKGEGCLKIAERMQLSTLWQKEAWWYVKLACRMNSKEACARVSCRRGSAKGCAKAAVFWSKRGDKRQQQDALTRACHGGLYASCAGLAELHKGNGDCRQAVANWGLACRRGYAPACKKTCNSEFLYFFAPALVWALSALLSAGGVALTNGSETAAQKPTEPYFSVALSGLLFTVVKSTASFIFTLNAYEATGLWISTASLALTATGGALLMAFDPDLSQGVLGPMGGWGLGILAFAIPVHLVALVAAWIRYFSHRSIVARAVEADRQRRTGQAGLAPAGPVGIVWTPVLLPRGVGVAVMGAF